MAVDTDAANLEGWDPMNDDFYHEENRYDRGAGANLPSNLQPANYKPNADNECILWVRPITYRYNEDSLRNLFSECGNVLEVRIVHPKDTAGGTKHSFGYVTFKTVREANDAIRKFNDDNNFDFKVSFAKTTSTFVTSSKKSSDHNRINREPFNFNNSKKSKKNGYSSDYGEVRNWRNRGSNQSKESRSISPATSERSLISFAFSEDIFPSKKKAPSIEPVKELLTMKPEVEPKSKISYISPLPCTKCSALVFKVCSACEEPFCSIECSLDGWRLHKGRKCVQIADLARSEDIESRVPEAQPIIATKSVNSTGSDEYNKFADLAQDYLENGRSFAETPKSQYDFAVDNNYDDNVDGGGYASEHTQKSDRSKTNDVKRNFDVQESSIRFGVRKNQRSFKDEVPRNTAQQRIERNRERREEQFTPQVNSSTLSDIDVREFIERRVKITQNCNINVIVSYIVNPASNICYVKLADEMPLFDKLKNLINETKSSSPLNISPKAKCLVESQEWCRGLVDCVEPLKVKLIDYGVVRQVYSSKLYELPAPFACIAPFAYAVKILSQSPKLLCNWKDDQRILTVKPVVLDGKIWTVEVVTEIPPKLSYPTFEEKLLEARKERDRVETRKSKNDDVNVSRIRYKTDDEFEKSPRPTSTYDFDKSPRPSTSTEGFDKSPRASTSADEVKRIPLNGSGDAAVERSCDIDDFMKPGVAIDVAVTYIKNEYEFFVAKVDKCCKLQELGNVDFTKLKALQSATVGTRCAAMFLTDCCCAEIISTEPLTIKYIDYGNEAVCELKDLRILPDRLAAMPALAVHVRSTEGDVKSQGVTENAFMTITPIKKNANAKNSWLVYVGDKSAQFEQLSKELNQKSVQVPKSNKIEEPKPPIVMDVVIMYAVSKKEYYGVRKTDVDALEELNGKLNGKLVRASSVEKDKVYAKIYEEVWSRARVMDLNPLNIYYIDYGNTEICEKEDLYELPKDIQNNPPPLAFRVSLRNETKNELQYGEWITVEWDMNTDTYTLLRDPSAMEAQTVSVGVVSS